MEEKKFSKKDILKKILKLSLKILYDILIVFCVLLILVVVWQVVTDNNESIGGYRLFRIISGSMVPEYNVDEVVVCKDTESEDIKIGDVIVYRGKTGELTNRLIMHEVIDKKEVDGNLIFYVKGIQNTTGDPDVYESQILGVVAHSSKILTWLYHLATSTYSSFVIIVILVINVFISFLPKKEKVITLAEPKVEEDDKNIDKNEEEKNEAKEAEVVIEEVEIIENELDEKEKLKKENKILEEEIKRLKEEINKKK